MAFFWLKWKKHVPWSEWVSVRCLLLVFCLKLDGVAHCLDDQLLRLKVSHIDQNLVEVIIILNPEIKKKEAIILTGLHDYIAVDAVFFFSYKITWIDNATDERKFWKMTKKFLFSNSHLKAGNSSYFEIPSDDVGNREELLLEDAGDAPSWWERELLGIMGWWWLDGKADESWRRLSSRRELATDDEKELSRLLLKSSSQLEGLMTRSIRCSIVYFRANHRGIKGN